MVVLKVFNPQYRKDISPMRHAKIQMNFDSLSTFGTLTWNHMELTTMLQSWCNQQILWNTFKKPPDSSAGSRWPEALSLLDTMQRADVQRDVVAWNAVMSACENLGECLLSMDGEVSFFKVWWMGGFVPKWME